MGQVSIAAQASTADVACMAEVCGGGAAGVLRCTSRVVVGDVAGRIRDGPCERARGK